MKTVAFHNLGCKVNSYEMELMQQKFTQKGYQIVPFDKKADIYVINTCTVTNIADRKSRQMLHKAKKMNPDGLVVAVGCYVQTDTEGALADASIDIAIGNNHKSEIVDIVERYNEKKETSGVISDLTKPVEYETGNLESSKERIRVDVKIQDGCNQFCTYCAIPLARGRIRSRRPGDIIEEVTTLSQAGFKEVVLTGIHLSSYGLDFVAPGTEGAVSYNSVACEGEFTNNALLEVIERVSSIEGIKRIRLGSLEPRVITKDFMEAISSNPKLCPHFHLSLQSGCDATLKRMNRRYSAAEYMDKVRMIREYYEHPAITTDIITGFPGETEEEFEESFEFVKSVNFYETHVFKYSKRKGTPAATMPGQNTEAVKAARSERLIALSDANRVSFERELIGKKVEVLLEEEKEINGVKWLMGHTGDYVLVRVPYGLGSVNEIVEVVLEEAFIG